MIVKLLAEHHLEFLSLKGGAEARPSIHMSKGHIVGNLMHWLILCYKRQYSLLFSQYSLIFSLLSPHMAVIYTH